ncbi:AB hydrolase superfamily protein YdjP [Candidatus Desulfarcum epimagneticum]|uniref:AB hydrolase superfamily protein YdjP n=1 Tax=uncultured Desulfobacteraceae bacterium TaxID=218296 RepID=A0A484HQY5_9BACT|nr:AB hydrolase superfamily protein YdjP [uncultured Desulfobacteraceae bacterium]
MKDEIKKIVQNKKSGKIKRWVRMTLAIFVLPSVLFVAGAAQAGEEWPRVVASGDGVPISYEVYGKGDPALVFVHGWSCDARYWRAQTPRFSRKHRVILLDLAGHGHSGHGRSRHTMRAFGEDVRAVAVATGGREMILIGHSMGGSVIAEAARLMPDRAIGLIGVDTLENIEHPMTRKQMDGMMAPLKKDFSAGVRGFAGGMISPGADPRIREWILSDMASAPPRSALSAMKEMMSQYVTGEAAAIFDEIRIPVAAVNGDLWPVNYKGNRRHMSSFDAIILKGADHFLMMTRPEEFNDALEKTIGIILAKRSRGK